MRHLNKGRKFGRVRKQRHALIKSLASSFFRYGNLTTTEAKAKELRPIVERHITKAKTPTLPHRRALLRIFSTTITNKIIESGVVVRSKNGGYTRIVKLGSRSSDGSKMARLELIK